MCEEVCQLRRWDVRKAAPVAVQSAEGRSQVIRRIIRETVRSFQVPKGRVCDREYLVDPANAQYVEKMNYFMRLEVGLHPDDG